LELRGGPSCGQRQDWLGSGSQRGHTGRPRGLGLAWERAERAPRQPILVRKVCPDAKQLMSKCEQCTNIDLLKDEQKATTSGKLPATKSVILRQVRCRLLSLFVAQVRLRHFDLYQRKGMVSRC